LNNISNKLDLDSKETIIKTPELSMKILKKSNQKCDYKHYIIKNVFLNVSKSKIDKAKTSNDSIEKKIISIRLIFDKYVRDKGMCSNPKQKKDDSIVAKKETKLSDLNNKNEEKDSSKSKDAPVPKVEEPKKLKDDSKKTQNEEPTKTILPIKCKTKFQTGNLNLIFHKKSLI
jgi:hypothetical protein